MKEMHWCTELSDHWIQCASGAKFNYAQPTLDSIELDDIATHLSNRPRFAGAMTYTVAQHSVQCSWLAQTNEDALACLFHDAHEAYWLDWPGPMKRFFLDYFDIDYEELVLPTQRLIECKFGVIKYNPEAVDMADKVMIATEYRDLMVQIPEWEQYKAKLPMPMDKHIIVWDALMAKRMFLATYWGLKLGIKEHIDLTVSIKGV